MSSTHQRGIILLLFFASCIGIAILTVRKLSFTCPTNDQKICMFLKNYTSTMAKPLHGVYTYSNNGQDLTYTVTWQKDKEKRIISMVQQEEPILDAILTREYVYLLDYSDKAWWKQSLSNSPLYQSYIPFDPYSYFFELGPVLMDPTTTYQFITETNCGEAKCNRYEVTSAKQSPSLQRFIYILSDEHRLYSVVDAVASAVHEIKIEAGAQWIYEPKETKTPTATQNIFLDYITRRDEKRTQELEYLKKFEDERKKAEESNETDLKYVDVNEESEEATPEAN